MRAPTTAASGYSQQSGAGVIGRCTLLVWNVRSVLAHAGTPAATRAPVPFQSGSQEWPNYRPPRLLLAECPARAEQTLAFAIGEVQ